MLDTRSQAHITSQPVFARTTSRSHKGQAFPQWHLLRHSRYVYRREIFPGLSVKVFVSLPSSFGVHKGRRTSKLHLTAHQKASEQEYYYIADARRE